ncbi:MAG: outer membrane lipoprotein-sorting protein [Planctomycetota bacterium]
MSKRPVMLASLCVVLLLPASRLFADRLEEILNTIRSKTADVRSFRADYVDTLRDLGFEMDQVRSGVLSLRKTDDGKGVLLHMVQKKPFEQHVYLTPERAVRYEPDNRIAHVVPLDPGKGSGVKESLDLLGDPAALEKKYGLTLQDDEDVSGVRCWKIHLVPLPDAGETDFREMTLWIDPDLGLPRKAQGLVHDGTELRTLEFRKLTTNPALPESEFQFRPPPGVDVDEVESLRL